MQSIDITSSDLAEQGFTLKIEGTTVVLESKNGAYPKRFTIHPKDWSRTAKRIEKELEESSFKQEVIQFVLKDMSDNFQTVIASSKGNGSSSTTSNTAGAKIISVGGNNWRGPKMAQKAIRADCTIEEWRTRVQEKYEALKEITNEEAEGLWTPLEFAISIKCILNIADISLPVIGVILGPPSSWKTVAVNMSKGARDTFGVDSFSPKAFVSHNTNMTEEELQQNDLLPKIKDKFFMVPELSPLFTSREEDLENIIGMIVRIGDGEGYTSASGAKGVRGYEGPIMFCWIGAAASIPYKIHKQLSKLGPKMYFLRLPMVEEDEDELLEWMRQNNFKERMNAIKTAYFDYLECLESCPEMKIDPESGVPKIEVAADNPEQEQAQRRIIYLAEMLAHLRGTVETWETQGTQGLDYAYASENIENPKRVMTQLFNLARAHALSQGRSYITVEDDIPLIIKVVLSGAASIERVKLLDLLLSRSKDKRYTPEEVAEAIGTSINTAKRVMTEFKALKLVEYEDLVGTISIRLRSGFDWFFTPEFKRLKGDFMTGDFKGQLVRKRASKDQQPLQGQGIL
jgi:hypothetical protein